MTDRIRTLTVHLDEDFRSDDVEAIASTIRMIRHVQAVTLGPPLDSQHHNAVLQAKLEMVEELRAILMRGVRLTRASGGTR